MRGKQRCVDGELAEIIQRHNKLATKAKAWFLASAVNVGDLRLGADEDKKLRGNGIHLRSNGKFEAQRCTLSFLPERTLMQVTSVPYLSTVDRQHPRRAASPT